jgi:hypothetical protein
MIWFFVRGSEHTFGTPTELLARFPAFPRALKLEGWHLPPIWSGAGTELRS